MILELGWSAGYVPYMTQALAQIWEEAGQLSAPERAELAEKLVGSLNFSEEDEIQQAWAAEAIRRRDEVRSGKVQTIPGEQVLAEVRQMLGR